MEAAHPNLALEVASFSAAPSLTLREVYDAHAAFVWSSLRRLGVPSADVADAAQEVFLVVHRKLPDFEPRASVRSWVFGVVRRVASDWRAKVHVRRETDLQEAPERSTSGETALKAIARKQARASLDQALAALDDDKRQVFVLFELEQLSMAEVADAVGCPLQTAYARLYAARRHIEAWAHSHAKDFVP